ncbi:AsmA family protein [Vibrio ruber DSM 16370]|uniref:AsmA family protein n=1 Tax=Vibrio ruber (strain DSM 16370 / JCM 11486 / BCRC 17186 / CECT 7878 / LMG 23124 / VR1) TaxID=1123498 RepID=A0A1R4LPN7_VIBR1|nr:AsmA family protein [Vibrio ruber]SJN58562.1 AsmA family protein [Vibrio ruber DSM 16370]
MKTGIIRIFLVSLLLILMGLTAGIVVIQSRYLTPVAQWTIQKIGFPDFHAQQISYQYPFHLKFEHVTLSQQLAPLQTVDVWLNPDQSTLSQLVFDSVLIDGLTLSNERESLPASLQTLKINQLAIRNLSVTTPDDLIIHGLNVQIQNPTWNAANAYLPYGDIQLYASQVMWQGETLTDLLMTGSYQSQHSQIDSLTAKWRGASLSLQAETNGQRWSIENLTTEKLNLSQSQLQQLSHKFRDLIEQHIAQIERLDLLNSQLNMPRIQLNNFDLSLTDFYPAASGALWKQNHAVLSLDAESLVLDKMMWIEPSINLILTPGQLDVDDFSATLMDGQFHASGSITPEAVTIRDLQAQSVKMFIESGSEPDFIWLASLIPSFKQVNVEQLKIRNSQVIQLAHQPYWQLSGINTDIDQAQLLNDQQWGLWQGTARVSVNNLSYGQFVVSQGLVEMHSQAQNWILDRLFLPFSKGYLAAKGQWQYGLKGAPWQFSVDADSLPLNLFKHLPLHLKGIADLSGSAQGLSGDAVIINHTLSGLLNLDIREGQLQLPDSNEQPRDFSINDIKITGDRGKLTVPEVHLTADALNATISGHWDLTQSEAGSLTLAVTTGEKQTHYNLLEPAKTVPQAPQSESGSTQEAQHSSAN